MNTHQLVGAALDWAVAKAEGYLDMGVAYIRNGVVDVFYFDNYSPSTDWAKAGLIIERERINLWCNGTGDWEAKQYGKHVMWASTPLVAAMQCYVSTKLGDEVEVPKEIESIIKESK